jgi:hypothetical protein
MTYDGLSRCDFKKDWKYLSKDVLARADMIRDAMTRSEEAVVHPLLNFFLKRKAIDMTGIDPRHRLHHLSLLPPGPDEVRDRLLRGGRPDGRHPFGTKP